MLKAADTCLYSKKFFGQLPSKWLISRKITTVKGVFLGQGTAIITQVNCTTLLYQEKLLLNGQETKVPAQRDYKFVLEEGKLVKKFVEGASDRLFYELKFVDETHARGTHLCARDLYQATYSIFGEDHFAITYEINGPQKCDTITTDFLRVVGEVEETAE